MELTFESGSPGETKALGARLARLLEPGDVVLLSGELGAGKTCLAQGIGKGLNVAEAVKSSSFVLVNEYHGRLEVHHADLFRLSDPGEVADLALEEIAANAVLLVEWPDRAWAEMPPERLLACFDILDHKRRRITFDARGARYEALLHQLSARGRRRLTAMR